jgi:hypothetical protein
MKTVIDLSDEIGITETLNPVPNTVDPRRGIEEEFSLFQRATYTMYELVRGNTGFGERPSFGERPGIL